MRLVAVKRQKETACSEGHKLIRLFCHTAVHILFKMKDHVYFCSSILSSLHLLFICTDTDESKCTLISCFG